jgi:exodeoxyribonuclease VII large subunit
VLLVERRRAALTQAGGRLRTLSPRATLERGYAIVRQDDRLVRSTTEVTTGDALGVEVADGSFGARVE